MPLQLKGLITVTVHSPLREPFKIKCKLNDGLPRIREILASKMDEKQLFLFAESKCKIELEKENGFELNNIVENDGSNVNYQLYLSDISEDVKGNGLELNNIVENNGSTEDVMVLVYLASEEPTWASLKLDDKLSTIREVLKEKKFKMDEKLLFYINGFIPSEEEDHVKLVQIVKEKPYELYLKVKVWEYLNKIHKLDYGSKSKDNVIPRAENRAFTMTDCVISDIPPRYHVVKDNKKDHQTTKNSSSVNVGSYISGTFGISRNSDKGTETNSSYENTFYSKSCLEFKEYLEPTKEFIEKLKKIKNYKDFKKIIVDYGQSIPTKIIMGGKIHKKENGTLKNKSKSNSVNADIKTDTVDIGAGFFSSTSKEIFSQHSEESHEGFGKGDDEESLNDEKNWVCIRYENNIDIFELLTNDPEHPKHKELLELRKHILDKVIGQRILHSGIEICEYTLNGREPLVKPFGTIPLDFLKNWDGFYIFAIILDKKNNENDFFNCQIWLNEGTPQYIIHCIQKDSLFSKTCKLQIKYTIIGNYTDFESINYDKLNSNIQLEIIKKEYDYNQPECEPLCDVSYHDNFIGIPVFVSKNLNRKNVPIIGHHFYTDNDRVGVFTFSYNLDQKKYDDLPKFSFYILKISNLMLEEKFNYEDIRKKHKKIEHPKYFSLRSSEKICGHIFFNYTPNKFKLQVVNVKKFKLQAVKCDCMHDNICQTDLEIYKKNIDFVYFDLPGEGSRNKKN